MATKQVYTDNPLCDPYIEILDLEDRVRDLEDERDSYRAWFQATLQALHDVTVERDRLREQNRELRRQQRRSVVTVTSENERRAA